MAATQNRDDSDARRAMRLCTWFSLGTGALGVLLLFMPYLLPFGGPWVQLALGVITLILAFRARRIGTQGVEGYDGRLSLLAAMAGFAICFFAGQIAFGEIVRMVGQG